MKILDSFNYSSYFNKLELDGTRTDAQYYFGLFRIIRTEFTSNQNLANLIIKRLKQIRFDARYIQNKFVWERDLDKKVVEWAYTQFNEFEEMCMDNFRVAKKSVRRQVRAYRRQQRNGCCGSIDFERRYELLSSVYLLGFNYGH